MLTTRLIAKSLPPFGYRNMDEELMNDEILNIARQVQQEIKTVLGLRVELDTPMVSEKLLDSIGVIDLSLALEDRFGIKIDTPEIKPENFESCQTLARFILNKKR